MKGIKKYKFLQNKYVLVLIVMIIFTLACFSANSQDMGSKVIRTAVNLPFYIDPGVGYDYTGSVILCNIYDTLVFPNNDGSVKSNIAKSWTISEDGLEYTFILNSGIKFHNGDEVTAEDVAFSMQRILDIGEGYAYLFLGRIKDVKVLGEYEVQFNLNEPFGPFLGTLVKLGIVNKKQVMENILEDGPYGEFGDYGKEWLVTHDAGSGPYQVVEMKFSEYFLMKKFDDYWAGWEDKEDAPDYVKMTGTTDPITVKTLIQRGEMELSDQYQQAENLEMLDQVSNVDISYWFEGSAQNILINNSKAPTDDVHFRRALAYCIDYDQIYNYIYPGSRPIAIVAQSIPGSDPNLEPYSYDLEKAKEELKKSPYYDELDNYPIEIYSNTGNNIKEKIALLFQSNCASIGIKAEIVLVPWLSIVEQAASKETTGHTNIIALVANYPEAGSLLESLYHSNTAGTWEQAAWLLDPEVDAEIDDAVTTINQEERFQKYYDIQEEMLPRAINIHLCEYPIRQAYRSDYVVSPANEARKKGELTNPILGYNFYYRDFKVYPEKANKPYTPFIP